MQAVNFEITLDAYLGVPCPYCGKQMQMKRWREPTRDHILPRSLGGSGRALNTLVVCFRCNQVKANMHPDAWLSWLREFRIDELKMQKDMLEIENRYAKQQRDLYKEGYEKLAHNYQKDVNSAFKQGGIYFGHVGLATLALCTFGFLILKTK